MGNDPKINTSVSSTVANEEIERYKHKVLEKVGQVTSIIQFLRLALEDPQQARKDE